MSNNRPGGTSYYVANYGSDSNDGKGTNISGTGSAWKTINHAAITMNAGDTASIRGGTYREEVYFYKNGTPANPFTFQRYKSEVPVISGADIFTGWTWVGGTTNAYMIPWTTSMQSSTTDYLGTNMAALRPEMLIFDGQVQWAVTNIHLLNNTPGLFYVDGPSTSPRAMYAVFPNWDNPNSGHTVEIATRNHNLYISGSNTVVNGLTCRYACNACGDPNVQLYQSAQYVLFENNTVEWANACGILSASNTSYNTFSNNLIQCNGEMGIAGMGNGQYWVNNVSASNNWKCYNLAWEAGGGKWSYCYNGANKSWWNDWDKRRREASAKDHILTGLALDMLMGDHDSEDAGLLAMNPAQRKAELQRKYNLTVLEQVQMNNAQMDEVRFHAVTGKSFWDQ